MDPVQRECLLLEQLPRVRWIAQDIHHRLPRQVSLEDLVQDGVIGLMDALSKYDPARNTQLKSYASFRIRGAILDSLRHLDWLPRDLRRRARQMTEAVERLTTRLGRAPGDSELAEEMGMPLDEFQRLRWRVSTRPEPAPEDDPFQLCLRAEMQELVRQALRELPFQQRQVLAWYHFEELTMKQVAEALAVCESRVSQIHSAALRGLRDRLQEMLRDRRDIQPRLGAPSQWRRLQPAPAGSAG